jgi:hypothetical protein
MTTTMMTTMPFVASSATRLDHRRNDRPKEKKNDQIAVLSLLQPIVNWKAKPQVKVRVVVTLNSDKGISISALSDWCIEIREFLFANERKEHLIFFTQGNRWSENKENLIRTNVDLANLRNKRPSKKKQRTTPLIVPREPRTH